MSRTFEVLERVQQGQELLRVPSITKAAPAGSRPTSPKVSSPVLDASARNEILRLVQCLFLATSGNDRHGMGGVVFCGIDEIDGGCLLCAEVGRSLAEQVQSQVCVVDANARVPASYPMFDLAPSDSSIRPELGATRKLLRQVTDNLWLLSIDSVGTNGGAPALEQMQACMKNLRDEFAYVLISAPPVGLYGDAVLLGQMAEGVVLVLEANSTRRSAAYRAKQALEAAHVPVLGTVLNNRTFPIPEKIYRLL